MKQKSAEKVNPANWTTKMLLNRCLRKKPDQEAWSEFVRRFHPTIKQAIVSALMRPPQKPQNSRSIFAEVQVDDFVQAVYMRIVRDDRAALKKFKGSYDHSIYSYLLMISINVVRDHFRELQAVKRPKIVCSIEDLFGEDFEAAFEKVSRPEIVEDKSKHLLTTEIIDDIFCRIKNWKTKDRDVTIFKLKFYEGLNNREIAKIKGLKLTSQGIGTIVSRTLRKIKHYLNQRRRLHKLENSRR